MFFMGYYGIPCKAAKRVHCSPTKCKITKPMTLTALLGIIRKVSPRIVLSGLHSLLGTLHFPFAGGYRTRGGIGILHSVYGE